MSAEHDFNQTFDAEYARQRLEVAERFMHDRLTLDRARQVLTIAGAQLSILAQQLTLALARIAELEDTPDAHDPR